MSAVPLKLIAPSTCPSANGCAPNGDSGDGGQTCCSAGEEGGCPPPPSSSSGFSQFPVRYATGEVRVIAQDLASSGLFPWGHTRSYSNQLTIQNEGVNGNSWFVRELPQLVQVSSTRVCLIRIIQEALWFDLVGSNYVPKFFVQDTLVHDTVAHEFIYTDTRGQGIRF